MSDSNTRAYTVARLQIVSALLAFGTIGIFIKQIALPSAEIALWRGIIAFGVLSLFMLAGKRFATLSRYKDRLGRLFLSGVAMGFNWILLFEAYRYTSVALSTLSYYFAPTIVIVGSAVFFKEQLTVKQIVCFIVSTAGLVLIIGVSGGGSNDFIGVLYGLGAAVLYGMVVLSNKGTGTIDGITRTWLQFAAAIIVLLPYVLLSGGFQIHTIQCLGLVNLVTVGVVHTGIMYYWYFSSLSHLRGQQVALLSYIDPMVAVVLSVVVLRESIGLWQLFGGLLILIATAFNELKFKRDY